MRLSLKTVLFLFFVLHMRRNVATPLDDYVNRADPTYRYDVIGTFEGPGYTLYYINMTSQTWKPDLQSQPIWWHYMSVAIPDNLDLDGAGFLIIGGGSNDNGPPSPTDEMVALTTVVAASTNSIAAYLGMIPNQPIVFKDDPAQQRRYEDAIIAWTWKAFVDQNGSDPEILLRMPMTKAGVRAMDTINDLSMTKRGTPCNRFLVTGASKRGWTTWTVSAVDERVVALAPMVMDLLNLQENLHHYYRSLGGWTFEFADYYVEDFTKDLDNPNIKRMADIIDPISYTDRYLTKPKYIISAGGDEFFMVDDSRFYFDKLKGATYLRMMPNTDHGLDGYGTNVVIGIRAFYLSVMMGIPLPEMTWNLTTTETGGKITMMTSTKPESVLCFYATTLDGQRKDFRFLRATPGDPSKPQVQPIVWLTNPNVLPIGQFTWEVEFNNPPTGWRAFFIQATFAGAGDSLLEFSTQTMVIPDTYPFPDCQGVACKGTLV